MANNYLNKKVDLTSTDITTLYTVPSETTGIIKSIIVSNDSASADTLTVTLTNGSNVFSVYKEEAVGAKTTKELLSQPLVVEETEIIKVTAATNLKTNKEYSSDKEAEDDVNDPNTDTKQEDISRSVNIKVAKMPDVISKSEDE